MARLACALALGCVVLAAPAWGQAPLAVAARLADEEAGVRRAAEEALANTGEAAFPALRALLGHPDFRVRRRAIRVALRIGDAARERATRAQPTAAAVKELQRAGRVVSELGLMLLERLAVPEPAADVRPALAFALIQLGYPQARAHLDRELSHGYWHRRKNAVGDLVALRDGRAAPYLRAALADDNWLVRRRAQGGLSVLPPEERATALAGLLADEEWGIRRDALRALVELGPSAGLVAELQAGALATALTDESTPVRQLAADVIALGAVEARTVEAGPSALAEAIAFGAAHDADGEVRAALVYALGRSDHADAEARVRSALLDDAIAVRVSAAAALAKLGHNEALPEAVGALVAALSRGASSGGSSTPSSSAMPPALLRTLMQRLGEPAALALLAPASTEGPSRARSAALDALAALGPSPALRGLAQTWLESANAAANVAGARLAERLGGGDALVERMVRLLSPGAGAEVHAACLGALAALAPTLAYKQRATVLLRAEALLRGVALPSPKVGHPSDARGGALSPRVGGFIAAILEQGPPPELLPSLARVHSRPVRKAALRWMARLGLGGAEVLRGLTDADAGVRAAALEAWLSTARELPGPGVATTGPLPAGSTAPSAPLSEVERARVAALLSDPSPLVREVAARAFAEEGEPRAVRMHRTRLTREAQSTDVRSRRMATLELAQLAVRGDLEAARLLGAGASDADAEVRRNARAGLRRTPLAVLAQLASEDGDRPSTWAAAHVFAQRLRDGEKTTTADLPRPALLAPLAKLTAAEADAIGELRAPRLANVLLARLPEAARTPVLRRYLERAVAPDLLLAWADALARQTQTQWRGTAPYNMRRQHLYDGELGAAVRALPGLPPRVLKALLFQESNLEPTAGNQYDCVGLAAFCRRAAKEESLPMSDRFRDVDADARYFPAQAIAAAVRHLARKADLLEVGAFARFGAPRGRDYWAFVLAAYNGGHAQVAEAMEEAYDAGVALAKERGLRGADAEAFARRHATVWENLLAPDEELEDSPLYAMTKRRYAWYVPYGRYRKMKGAEAKYHEIGQFPLDILDRAYEDPRALAAPAARLSERFAKP